MKTRKQKVICRVLCMVVSILLLASFFVVPVSALDQLTTVVIQNEMYEYGSDHHDPDQRPYSSFYLQESSMNLTMSFLNTVTSSIEKFLLHPSSISGNPAFMEFSYSDVVPDSFHYGIYYINQLFDDGVTRTFATGDTLYIDAAFFGVYLYDDMRITQFRFTLRELGNSFDFSFDRVVASTDTINVNVTDNDGGFDYDRLSFNFTQDITSNSLCLCLEFKFDITQDEVYFELEESNFTIQFGAGVSPNYPIYPSAPGKDEVNGYGSAEQELIGSQESGMQEGLDAMTGMENILADLDSSLQFGAFTTKLSGVLDRIVSIPGLDALVHISMALGLFASLMALAASIVHAADRKAGQAKREAARDAKSDKKK